MKTTYSQPAFISDEELITRIIAGETSLLEIVIRRYNPLLYKIARSYGLNHEDAEDMMQESFFAAYTMLPQFRKEASFKTWLTRIHLHKCYHKISYGHFKYEEAAPEALPENTHVLHPSQDQMQTEKTIINRELAGLLELSLQQLPLIYRNVFVLREVEGFSIAETASLLDISQVNVKVRLNRAKAMLQKQLEHFYTSTELYEFNLCYCDKIVAHVLNRIAGSTPTNQQHAG